MSFVSVSGSTLTLTLGNATLTAGHSINFRCIDPNGSDDASGIIQSAPGGLDSLGFDAVLTVGAARPVPALQSPSAAPPTPPPAAAPGARITIIGQTGNLAAWFG